MSDKAMLILDRNLVEKIDTYRSDFSRAEFIEFCVDNHLEELEKSKPPELAEKKARDMGTPATREEFKEFKQNIRDLIRALLEFFITFGLDLAPSKTTELPDTVKEQLRNLLGGI